jgi:hypothetical protein
VGRSFPEGGEREHEEYTHTTGAMFFRILGVSITQSELLLAQDIGACSNHPFSPRIVNTTHQSFGRFVYGEGHGLSVVSAPGVVTQSNTDPPALAVGPTPEGPSTDD